jgi:ElaB/YqjD/DUF883 family membrane-anchored ribosome-binding protein
MFATSKNNKPSTEKQSAINEGGHTMDDIKDTVHQLKADACEAAAVVKDDVENMARRTGQHARELADSAGHSLAGIAEAMRVRIREKPVQSSAIAIGIGLVVGMLYSRR